MMAVDDSLNTVNDDDEKDVWSACANVDQVEPVVAGTIDALDELVPYLEAAQLGGWHSANIRPNVEWRVCSFGDLPHRLNKRGAKGRLIELFGRGSHGLMSFRYTGREDAPNDPKLSDRGVRRGTCMVGGKGAAEAGAVTHGAVRCSAWLGDVGTSSSNGKRLIQFGVCGGCFCRVRRRPPTNQAATTMTATITDKTF